jgi:hypothetical protein
VSVTVAVMHEGEITGVLEQADCLRKTLCIGGGEKIPAAATFVN